jgi:hypothetical protein
MDTALTHIISTRVALVELAPFIHDYFYPGVDSHCGPECAPFHDAMRGTAFAARELGLDVNAFNAAVDVALNFYEKGFNDGAGHE